MSDDGEVGWDLVMPFVVTVSHGGPFDDAAFTAGYEMGVLAQRCRMMDAMGVPSLAATIRRANLAQADLIAMQCERHLAEVVDSTLPCRAEWAFVIISADDLSAD